jgi:hypothetical protein
MHYLFRLLCVCALGVVPLLGCGDTTGSGGQGGMAGVNGGGGYSGYPSICDEIDCNDGDACTRDLCDPRDGSCGHTPVICDDDNECTHDGCNPMDGCHYTQLDDGTSCGGGAAACQAGSCIGTFPCTEAGIRHAIAVGAGPHTFNCGGPTTVVTEAPIIIDNDVILDGQGNLTVDAGYDGGELTGNEHRVFSVREDATAELHGFTVTGGHAVAGGGIRNGSGATLTLKDTTVSGNSGEVAAGIHSSGTMTLINSLVSGNVSRSDVSYSRGVGGIASTGYPVGLLILVNSTVSGNSGAAVGGIRGDSGLVIIANSTVAENVGSTVDGIWDGRSPPPMAPTNGSSMTEGRSTGTGGTGGTAGRGGAGGIGGQPGQFTVTSSLIQGECAAGITSYGYNIESPGNTCGFEQTGDQVGVSTDELKLGPLQDNGGPTMTHALLPGSVAIDRIPEAECLDADGDPLRTDQRGQPRPETGGSMCDVGAFEAQPEL